jgi:hypothetical protein
MNRTIRRAFAAAAAGAAAAALGVTGAQAASADAQAAAVAGPPLYTDYEAGYLDQGPNPLASWRFRYVATTVKMQACKPESGPTSAKISLLDFQFTGATISLACGGGGGSVSFSEDFAASGTFRLAPRVGDVLKISIYRDRRASRDYFTATNTRSGRSVTTAVATSRGAYRYALLVSLIDSQVTPPAQDVRLWQFTNSHVTSYSGRHGSITGPWQTREVIEMTGNIPFGTVVASPSRLANNGQNFGVWLRAAS